MGKRHYVAMRFQVQSLSFFGNPEAAKKISNILGEAILAWGDATPVKFDRTDTNWDFEIKMKAQEEHGTMAGCRRGPPV